MKLILSGETKKQTTEIYVRTTNGDLNLIGETELANVPKIYELVEGPTQSNLTITKPTFNLEMRLKEILKERRIEQQDFAKSTGLSTRTISELCTGKMKRYPKDVIEKIVTELKITDMNILFKINTKRASSN